MAQIQKEDKISKLRELMKPGVEKIKNSERIRLVSHFDSDGISSAAIILSSLLGENKNVHLSIVKQMKPELIRDLNDGDYDLVLFTDLGSGYLDYINELDSAVVVVDHHQIQGEIKNGYHVNPLMVDMEEDEISGAGTTYLLSKELNEKNKKLAGLAVVGAIGDIQECNWEMRGFNKEILKEAEEHGGVAKEKTIRIFGRSARPIHKALEYNMDPFIPGVTGNESAALQFLSETGIETKDNEGKWRTLNDLTKEESKKLASAIICERIRNGSDSPEEVFGYSYTLKGFGDLSDAREFSTALNACGRMGKGSLGVTICLNNGIDQLKGILTGYRKLIAKYINWVRENPDKIKETKNARYILAGDEIDENFIGTVTTISQNSFYKDKPLFGFAETEDGGMKVSGRIMKGGSGLNLKKIFEEVAKKCGGEGGGHKSAGGAYIPLERVGDFIDLVEGYLKY